jgi:CspA family cold shock protein
MERGTVVRLIRDRGFGFIRLQDGSEVFFHHSAMNPGEFDSLQDGEELEFSIEQDPRGRGSRAANVRRIGTTTNA